jgi:hypothetical protein
LGVPVGVFADQCYHSWDAGFYREERWLQISAVSTADPTVEHELISVNSLNILNLVISLISLIMICLEINMFQHGDLRPSSYLISCIVKLVLEAGSVGLMAFKLSVEWKFKDWLNLIYLFACLALAVSTL